MFKVLRHIRVDSHRERFENDCTPHALMQEWLSFFEIPYQTILSVLDVHKEFIDIFRIINLPTSLVKEGFTQAFA